MHAFHHLTRWAAAHPSDWAMLLALAFTAAVAMLWAADLATNGRLSGVRYSAEG